jgi:uncharacterized protein YbjT (DUF2867 family)
MEMKIGFGTDLVVMFFRDKYLAQSRWRGGIYLPGSGDVRMRPVYVGDVAAIMAKLVRDDKAVGQIVELYGYIF